MILCLFNRKPVECNVANVSAITVEDIEEGSEPDEFWELLGGKKYYCALVNGTFILFSFSIILSSLLSPILPSCSLSLSYHFLSPEPAKHNYVPRLFELSSTSGTFRPNEILCPSRSENKICAFPFLQEDLYTANQPGNHANNGLRGPSLSDWLHLKNS